MKRPKKPVRYYSPKRRAIMAKGDKIDALELFERHGWICCVCRGRIDKHRRVPDWGAATIEHKVPLSAGGTHTWDNVAPAHYGCNLAKGDKILQSEIDVA